MCQGSVIAGSWLGGFRLRQTGAMPSNVQYLGCTIRLQLLLWRACGGSLSRKPLRSERRDNSAYRQVTCAVTLPAVERKKQGTCEATFLYPKPNLSDSSFRSLESTNADGLARSICETQWVDHPHPYPLPSRGGNLLRSGRLPPPSAGGGEGEGDQNRSIQAKGY
jgi:hypothetical protein